MPHLDPVQGSDARTQGLLRQSVAAQDVHTCYIRQASGPQPARFLPHHSPGPLHLLSTDARSYKQEHAYIYRDTSTPLLCTLLSVMTSHTRKARYEMKLVTKRSRLLNPSRSSKETRIEEELILIRMDLYNGRCNTGWAFYAASLTFHSTTTEPGKIFHAPLPRSPPL